MNFPNSPTDGYIWWFGENVRNYVYKSSVPAWTRPAGTAMPKNYLVNPAFQISDQNGLTDVSNIAGAYLAECWNVNYVLSNGVYRGQRVAAATPGGGKHRLRISMTTAETAVASGEWIALGTTLEGNRMTEFKYGQSSGIWGVLRFGCKGPAGTYCVAHRNNGVTRSFISPFTIPASLANIDHVQVLCIPPCTTGSWPIDSTAWGYLQWVLFNGNWTSNEWNWLNGNFAGGSSLSNTFPLTVGNTFELFDVGFYLDPNITGVMPEFEVPHIEDDHRDCLRYWYRLTVARGIVQTATTAHLYMPHPVPVRVQPSSTLVGASLRLYDGGVAPNMTSISSVATSTEWWGATVAATAGGMTVGRACNMLADSQIANYIAINARL